MGRMSRILGGQGDFPASSAHIQAVACSQFIHSAVHRHRSCSTDIDNAQFTALKKILRTEFFSGIQRQHLIHRHGAACDDSVDMAVHHFHDIFLKQIINQKLIPKSGRVIGLDVAR